MSKRKKYYLEYLKSDHWAQLRQEAFTRDSHKCRCCGKGKLLTGHHLRYPKDLYSCTVKDILTLCWPCHKTHHNGKKLARKEKRLKKRLRREQRKQQYRDTAHLIGVLMFHDADEPMRIEL